MRLTLCAAALALATQASAGGIDMTGQSIGFIFKPGTVAELGFGRVAPSVTGNDAATFGGGASGNIGSAVILPTFSFKHDFTDKLSAGIIYEQPFGADVTYGATSLAFAGTTAGADTSSLTAILRYKLSDRISVYGGPRWQSAEASFLLTGTLYGPLSGYSATMARDNSVGYVVGAAFEIPEYFIRASLTYNSAIEHSFTTTETSPLPVSVSQVSSTTPQSVNFEFNAGVAPNTFVFGGARWVEWSALQFAPPVLSGFSTNKLVNFDDTVTYRLGVGRRINENWTGLASVIYEPSTSPLTTPLSPVDGFYGLSLGAIYTRDNLQIQANATAMRLGDATPFVPSRGSTVSSFTGNTSVGFGIKVTHTF